MKTIFCVIDHRLCDDSEVIGCWQFRHEAEKHIAELEKIVAEAMWLWEEHRHTLKHSSFTEGYQYWDNLIKSNPEYSQYPDYEHIQDHSHYHIAAVPYHD